MARKKICGIYKIVFPNGKVYVGQSVDCYDRFQQHYRSSHPEKYSFKNKRDINLPVHKAMAKYENVDNGYAFEILEECTKSQLDAREQYWIQNYIRTFLIMDIILLLEDKRHLHYLVNDILKRS